MTHRHALGYLLLCFAACACKPAVWVDLVSDQPADAGRTKPIDAAIPITSDASRLDASDDSTAPDAASFVPVARCGVAACDCDDGLDNDQDGWVDGLDPECTGALDEDEATFATGKPSKVRDCRDCFWDEDTGNGNDACRYPSECLRGATPNGNGNGKCSSCVVAETCLDSCRARTPSGCDCFGCCEVSRPNGAKLLIELSDRCSFAKLDDAQACPPCRQSAQCRNTCGRCELCPGRSVGDLPADCRSSGSGNRCEEGQPACSTSGDCAANQYCQLGCCFALLL